MQLVNMPASKVIPSVFPNANAWAETSMNTYSTPQSAISRRTENRQIGSGVVSSGAIALPAKAMPSVPMTPVLLPAARKMLSSM